MTDRSTPNTAQGALSNSTKAMRQFISDVLTERPSTVYRLDDYGTIRKLLFDNVKSSISRRFPLRNERYTLDIEDLDYDDPEDIDVNEQKKLILEGKSSSRRLRGAWVLRDAVTDTPVTKTRRMTLMRVPRMSERGTFIRNGKEYSLGSIMRLEPGVYCKRRPDEVSAQFNIQQGTGRGFHMVLSPDTGVFKLRKGTVNAPAYTVLHDFGVTDESMRKSWGDDVFEVNRKAGTSSRALQSAQRLYEL